MVQFVKSELPTSNCTIQLNCTVLLIVLFCIAPRRETISFKKVIICLVTNNSYYQTLIPNRHKNICFCSIDQFDKEEAESFDRGCPSGGNMLKRASKSTAGIPAKAESLRNTFMNKRVFNNQFPFHCL